MDIESKGIPRRTRRPEPTADMVFDYKDEQLLKKFITERGKILPRRLTGLSRAQQKALENAIKRARQLALVPYTVHHFTVDFNQYQQNPESSSGFRHGPPYGHGGHRFSSRERHSEAPPLAHTPDPQMEEGNDEGGVLPE